VISALSIDVAASPAVVFALARDPARWATLLPHYRRSQGGPPRSDGSLVVAFKAVRPLGPWGVVGLPVAWRARTWSEASTCRLRFVHLGGATRGMSVTWTIASRGAGARVTITHDFPAPRPWAWFIDRAFTRPIASRTLATFRALAEAVAASDLPRATNQVL
jgi:hypothetical protein